MDLVDDVYFVSAPFGGVFGGFSQLTGIVYGAVGGCVYLDDIGESKVVCVTADIALTAGRAVYGVLAVERLGKILAQVVLPVPLEPVNR